MKLPYVFLPIAGALLVSTEAFAGTCTIEITGPKERYKFVHVYDVAARTIVMRQAIKSGDSKEVTVSENQVRVDWKFAGGIRYETGRVQPCQGGNRLKV